MSGFNTGSGPRGPYRGLAPRFGSAYSTHLPAAPVPPHGGAVAPAPSGSSFGGFSTSPPTPASWRPPSLPFGAPVAPPITPPANYSFGAASPSPPTMAVPPPPASQRPPSLPLGASFAPPITPSASYSLGAASPSPPTMAAPPPRSLLFGVPVPLADYSFGAASTSSPPPAAAPSRPMLFGAALAPPLAQQSNYIFGTASTSPPLVAMRPHSKPFNAAMVPLLPPQAHYSFSAPSTSLQPVDMRPHAMDFGVAVAPPLGQSAAPSFSGSSLPPTKPALTRKSSPLSDAAVAPAATSANATTSPPTPVQSRSFSRTSKAAVMKSVSPSAGSSTGSRGNKWTPSGGRHSTGTGVSPSLPAQAPSGASTSRASPSPMRSGLVWQRQSEERENEAKAKRLVRFRTELTRPAEDTNMKSLIKRESTKQHNLSDVQDMSLEPNDATDESLAGGTEKQKGIVGLCSDMCPESERAERERKGDLDVFERLDGERNKTSNALAVKKFNRMAERDADLSLIRPLPVLKITMDYLLGLLTRPYDNNFLTLYNFLWDRMRAIRMDLRMQYIVNHEAITMLEQMIRLHIIAMHELCEYSKGEGFSEGFDDHLNIEQLNKASVELLQMYDDQRRKGVSFVTENEFRCYYALLKLDTLPGYKVERSELTLDLAKMPLEVRTSQEVSFAIKVARAFRTGNYISFFRIAKKASYLQACLMHAHFLKVRSQALATLHSGLQMNGGIPVTTLEKWLSMEGEDIKALLEYHGFALKQFEELYSVKQGPFVYGKNTFRISCSQLVQQKRADKMIADVCPVLSDDTVMTRTAPEGAIAIDEQKVEEKTTKGEISAEVSDNIVPDKQPGIGILLANPVAEMSHPYHVTLQQEVVMPAYPSEHQQVDVPLTTVVSEDDATTSEYTYVSVSISAENDEDEMSDASSPETRDEIALLGTSVSYARQINPLEHEDYLIQIRLFDTPSELDKPASPETSEAKSNKLASPETSEAKSDNLASPGTSEAKSDKPSSPETSEAKSAQEEVVMSPAAVETKLRSEKLKKILRKWKQRVDDKKLYRKLLRERTNDAAITARRQMTFGPPIQLAAPAPKIVASKFNLKFAVKGIQERLEKSRSVLNVAELVAPLLTQVNPTSQCICWKLLIILPASVTGLRQSQSQLDSTWLLNKLIGDSEEDSDLLVSSPHLSVRGKWLPSSAGTCKKCCLSVIRASDLKAADNDVLVGTSSLLFPVSSTLPWELQKECLSNLLASLPSGANLPLLIVSFDTIIDGCADAAQELVKALGLQVVEGSKIASYNVIFLRGRQLESDDDAMREGLCWLASHSPPQPSGNILDTHQLLMSYLKPLLKDVENRETAVGPDEYISAFNRSLDLLGANISRAASVNPVGWPCPETKLLKARSDEKYFVNSYLPEFGWSHPSTTEKTLSVIRSCKLKEFSFDISWLSKGSYMGRELSGMKAELKRCLISYMADSVGIPYTSLVEREAHLMIQREVALELRNSSYFMVPRWGSIFRRIYDWMLQKLMRGAPSCAYVLERNLSEISTTDLSYHYGISPHPDVTFDELVEICCNIPINDSQFLEHNRNKRSRQDAEISTVNGGDEIGLGLSDNGVSVLSPPATGPGKKIKLTSTPSQHTHKKRSREDTDMSTVDHGDDTGPGHYENVVSALGSPIMGPEISNVDRTDEAGLRHYENDVIYVPGSPIMLPGKKIQMCSFQSKDNLSLLMERCNETMNDIEKILCIYF